MNILTTLAVTFFAGMGAGLGTGFAGMSAAAVISPMLIAFLGMEPYMAVGIALASAVLASAVSAYTYGKNKNLRAVQSLVCGVVIGLICGFVGAGGGMMMLLILTSVLGYELKTAVGTSVFIMAFTALTGAVSHFAIGGAPDVEVLILCVVFTFVWARIAAVFANRAEPKTLNRATGVVLVVLGAAIFVFSLLK